MMKRKLRRIDTPHVHNHMLVPGVQCLNELFDATIASDDVCAILADDRKALEVITGFALPNPLSSHSREFLYLYNDTYSPRHVCTYDGR